MPELDGILTFHSSHHAVRAERVLQLHNIPCRNVPCPRELSSSCGVALRFPGAELDRVGELLREARVDVESIRHYPEAKAVPSGWSAFLQRARTRQGGGGGETS